MANYTPCTGTDAKATNTRRVSGATGKYFHLNGKTFGHCPECGKTSLRVNEAGAVPAHKAA